MDRELFRGIKGKNQGRKTMTNYKAKLKQGGIIVAEAESSNKEDAEREIQHYALIYSQDGEVEIIRNYKEKNNDKRTRE